MGPGENYFCKCLQSDRQQLKPFTGSYAVGSFYLPTTSTSLPENGGGAETLAAQVKMRQKTGGRTNVIKDKKNNPTGKNRSEERSL